MKISNIDLQKLRSSLRTSKSPGKRKLVNAIKEENYTVIVAELLFRFELYCSEKVLRYTKADQNQIVNNILLHGVDVVAESVIETYYSADDSNSGLKIGSKYELTYEWYDLTDDAGDVLLEPGERYILVSLDGDIATITDENHSVEYDVEREWLEENSFLV